MKFLVTYHPPTTPAAAAADSAPGEKMSEYADRSMKAGILLTQGMFGPTATEIRLEAGRFSVVEGGRESAGYAFLRAASPDDAVKFTNEFFQVAGGGTTKIRQATDDTP